MNNNEIFTDIDNAFGKAQKPEHSNLYYARYDDPNDEFKQHDELLNSKNRDSLIREDLGSIGWNPVDSMTADGWRYWLPSLARISVEPENTGREPFLWDLLQFFQNPQKKEFINFSQEERIAILLFLKKLTPIILEKFEPDIEVEFNLNPVIKQWEVFCDGDSKRSE
jgi:hypothetical protein